MNKLMYPADQKGFWLDSYEEPEIQEGEYKDFLYELADLCTSPKGVCPRWHIREREDWKDEDGELCFKDDGGVEFETTYELWSWGTNGNNPYKADEFEDLEDAETALLLCWENEAMKEDQRPSIFYTNKEELVENELAEQ